MSETETLVHISDTHFGTERPEVERALVERINALSPSLLILSGDVTQRARTGQFARAVKFLKKLRYGKLLCVPGNHDMPLYNVLRRMISPFDSYAEHLDKRSVQQYQSQHSVVMGINSCNPWHYKNGRIRASTLRDIELYFGRFPDSYLKVLVAHHPVDVIQATDEENILPGVEALLTTCCNVGVDAILGGHIHFQFCRSLKHRYPGLPRKMLVCQAGTALSSRVRAGQPNSFMEINVPARKQELVIQQWDFIESASGFQPTAAFQPLLLTMPNRNPHLEQLIS